MDIENILRSNINNSFHLSLGTSRDGRPWVSEVHFAFDDELNLYFRSLSSRRHSQDIAANPNVAGNIVRQHSLEDEVLGVYFEGVAERLDPDKLGKAYDTLSQRLGVTSETIDEARTAEGHQFYKITVKDWYVFGNLDGTSYQKYRWER